MQAYSTPDVQQTFGWGLDPECRERMLKLMDEAKHDDHVHSPLPRGEKTDPIASAVDGLEKAISLLRDEVDRLKSLENKNA